MKDHARNRSYFKLFVLILASPSHGLPVLGNLQDVKNDRRHPSSDLLNIRQLGEDVEIDGDDSICFSIDRIDEY